MRVSTSVFVLLLAITAFAGAIQSQRLSAVAPEPVSAPESFSAPESVSGGQPLGQVEVVFVLDTTGSMSGLLEGAKSKIWSIAGQMARPTAAGRPAPRIRMGLVAYRDRGDDYVTRRFDLTTDIDALYGKLLEFAAQGGGDGPESVNAALHDAVHRMDWTPGPAVYRVVFLVGDAPPHMDYANDVQFPATLVDARQRGIIVNAIQCGNLQETTAFWHQIAQAGAGQYAAIPADGGMVAIHTPMDDELARLNQSLAGTVLPWGDPAEKRELAAKAARARAAPASVAASRLAYFSKSADGAVNSGRADLLDALAHGEAKLEELPAESLPSELQPLSPEEREGFIAKRSAHRDALRKQIAGLVDEREAYLRKARAESGSNPDDAFDRRILEILRDQAGGLL